MSTNTLREIVDKHVNGDITGLLADLTAREDAALDYLRLASVQFGLPYMEIVAEVLAGTGLGTPLEPEARQMVRDQFNDLMDRLREEYRNQHPDQG